MHTTPPLQVIRIENSCFRPFMQYFPARILLAIALIVGGLFLLLAAYRVFPSGVNAISHLGNVGYGIGYGLIGTGVLATTFSLFCSKRRPHVSAEIMENHTPLTQQHNSLHSMTSVTSSKRNKSYLKVVGPVHPD